MEPRLAALERGEPLAVVAAVRQCTDRLPSAEWGAGLDALSAKLEALSAHERPREGAPMFRFEPPLGFRWRVAVRG